MDHSTGTLGQNISYPGATQLSLGAHTKTCLLVSWTITLFLYSFFLFTQLSMCWSHDWYYLVTLLLSLSFRCSTLSMPITFWSYLNIISEQFSYCPMLHSLLSILLSLYLLHSVLLFYILLSSYWTFHSTYLLALSLIVIPTKFQVFLMFLLADNST